MNQNNLRLNLGAGAKPLADYINVDRNYPRGVTQEDGLALWSGDVYPLAFDDETVDEIRASHILEHFSHRQTVDVLADWIRVLRPGGMIAIAVPNFEWIARKYIAMVDDPSAKDANIQGYVMGGHIDANDEHGAIFDEAGLRSALEQLGIERISYWESKHGDCAALPVSLNLVGYKKGGEPENYSSINNSDSARNENAAGFAIGDRVSDNRGAVGHGFGNIIKIFNKHPRRVTVSWDNGEISSFIRCCVLNHVKSTPVPEPDEAVSQIAPYQDPRFANIQIPRGAVAAVATVPRLGFTDTQFCIIRAVSAHAITFEQSGGVFWDQGMTRVFESHLDDGTKYLLAIDYDSLFTAEDVQTLYGIMEARPDIDALCPVQIRRENDHSLFTVSADDGKSATTIDRSRFETDVLKIRTGHFGLTMIRVEALRRLPRPWFHARPDTDGSWGDGRVDSDVAFWLQWGEAGNSLYLSNRVAIGHLQLMATWPSADLGLTTQYVSDWLKNGKPAGAWR